MNLWKYFSRNTKEIEQLRIPIPGAKVVERGPRGVGRVRGVHPAAGEPPEKEGVHGAEGELSRLRASPRAVHPVQHPADLRRGEVGIEEEAGALRHERLVPRIAERRALRRGSPVLPDDGAVDRPARRTIPHEHRLALVRDAEGGDRIRAASRPIQHRADRRDHRRPQLLRIVLHLAGAGEVLGERLLGGGHYPRRLVEEQRAGGRRALVDGEYVSGHVRSPPPLRPRFMIAGSGTGPSLRPGAGREGGVRTAHGRPQGRRADRIRSSGEARGILLRPTA